MSFLQAVLITTSGQSESNPIQNLYSCFCYKNWGNTWNKILMIFLASFTNQQFLTIVTCWPERKTANIYPQDHLRKHPCLKSLSLYPHQWYGCQRASILSNVCPGCISNGWMYLLRMAFKPSFTFVCLRFDANKIIDINAFKTRKLEKRLRNEEPTATSIKQLSLLSCSEKYPQICGSLRHGARWSQLQNGTLLWNGPLSCNRLKRFCFQKKLDPRTLEAWRHTKNEFFRIIAQCKMMEVDSENVRASHLQAPLLVAVCACGFPWNPEAYACVG